MRDLTSFWLLIAGMMTVWVLISISPFRRALREARLVAKALNVQPSYRFFDWAVRGFFEGREVRFSAFAYAARGSSGSNRWLQMTYRGLKKDTKSFRWGGYPQPTSTTYLRGQNVGIQPPVLNQELDETRTTWALKELTRACEIVETNGLYCKAD